MAVELLEPGFVKIEPDVLDWTDVLLSAQALLEEHGWIKGDSGSRERGFSLHGAIGEAAAELTGDPGGKSGGIARPLREEAIRQLSTTMGGDYAGRSNADITWNDKQRGKRSVISLINKTLGR